MEDTETTRLSHRKESAVLVASECTTPDSRLDPHADDFREVKSYPFALVLRLRVLQIVCGISTMVMGTVAFIEERGEMNLGLGIPAGGATVLAAAVSIHMSRGFGGYQPSSCGPSSTLASLRFLGPSVRIAGPLALLWGTACSLHAAVLVQACITLATTSHAPVEQYHVPASPSSPNLLILAVVHLALAVATLTVVLTVLRIDCRYDPD